MLLEFRARLHKMSPFKTILYKKCRLIRKRALGLTLFAHFLPLLSSGSEYQTQRQENTQKKSPTLKHLLEICPCHLLFYIEITVYVRW